MGHWAFSAPGPVSCPSAAEAGVAWFRFASRAVYVGVDCVGSPEPAVVPSSSAPSTECASSSYVHWDWDVVHATGCVGGVEAVRILVVECSVRVALEVLLEVCKCAAAKPSRLELWARYVGRIAALLFQYVVEKLLASSDLYSALF